MEEIKISENLAESYKKLINQKLKYPGFSKEYKFDYPRFINEVISYAENVPDAQNLCYRIASLATFCQSYIEEKRKNGLSPKKISKLELACYRAIKAEIVKNKMNYDVFIDLILPQNIIDANSLINNLEVLLFECLNSKIIKEMKEDDEKSL